MCASLISGCVHLILKGGVHTRAQEVSNILVYVDFTARECTW